MLLSYSTLNHDYDVDCVPIQRTFRAQMGASVYGQQLMASTEDRTIPLETDSRLHEQAVGMVAGHDSTTPGEGPSGGISGHVVSMPFPPLVEVVQLPAPQQQGHTAASNTRPHRRRGLKGPA